MRAWGISLGESYEGIYLPSLKCDCLIVGVGGGRNLNISVIGAVQDEMGRTEDVGLQVLMYRDPTAFWVQLSQAISGDLSPWII